MRHGSTLAAVTIAACLATTSRAGAQGDEILIRYGSPLHPAEWRAFGIGHRSPDDHITYRGEYVGHHGDLAYSRNWPAQLVYRPMSPWSGLLEAKTVTELDLGANHAGSPIRLGASVAYGLDADDPYWRHPNWGVAVDIARGLCLDSGDDRCERRLDQIGADVVYVSQSRPDFEWLVRGGLATGPFSPFTVGARVGLAAKLLFHWAALQIEPLVQIPVNQLDTVPTLVVVPVQLQIKLLDRLAATVTSGERALLLSGHEELTIPVGVGLLLGSNWGDVGVEWRFPRGLGHDRTWDERLLFVTLAVRAW